MKGAGHEKLMLCVVNVDCIYDPDSQGGSERKSELQSASEHWFRYHPCVTA